MDDWFTDGLGKNSEKIRDMRNWEDPKAQNPI